MILQYLLHFLMFLDISHSLLDPECIGFLTRSSQYKRTGMITFKTILLCSAKGKGI